jgi:glycosyltransferase involved in cell wall biosynthesis
MLRDSLESLICQETDGKFSFEILVIDNGSMDGTSHAIAEVGAHSPVEVRRVEEKTKGYAYALNRGVVESRAEWLAFFDDDQLAAVGWLKELYRVAVDKKAPLVGGSMTLALSQEELARLGPLSRAQLGEKRRSWSEVRKCSRRRPLVSVGSGNLLVKRTVFDSIGMFESLIHAADCDGALVAHPGVNPIANPPNRYYGGCDVDFIERAMRAGFDLWWAPKAVGRHVIPAHRLKPEYQKRIALRFGTGRAYRDRKLSGRLGMVQRCIARIGQALLMTAPRLLVAWAARDQAKTSDWQYKLLQAQGYVRTTLHLLAPWMFAQERFFESLDRRGEM